MDDSERRPNAWLAVLTSASDVLARHAYDTSALLDAVARLISDAYGDYCQIALIEPDGVTYRIAAAYHSDPEVVALAREVNDLASLRVGEGLSGGVAASGKPLVILNAEPTSITGELRPAHRAWTERYPVRSLAIMPLRGREGVIGTLGISRAERGRPYDDADLSLLADLADRAALAIENARLHQVERSTREKAEAVAQQLRESEERLSLALEGGAMGTWEWDPNTGRVTWDARTERLFGIEPGAFDGSFAAYRAAIHPDDRTSVEAAIGHAMEAVNDFETEHRVVRTDGEVRWLLGRGRVYRDANGRPARVAGTTVDITNQKRVEAAQRLLVDASAVLASSLDYEATLASVARLATPTLADWCVIDLADLTGTGPPRLRRVAAAHADPDKQEHIRQLRENYPVIEPGADHTARRVFDSGQLWFDPKVGRDRLVSQSRNPVHFKLVEALGFAGEMVIPLVARGQALGTMTLVTGSGRRPYDQADLAVGEEIARRCALAIDNARLYAQAQAAVRVRDEFLGIAAHDLRTPMTSLRGFAQLVMRQLDRNVPMDPVRLRRALSGIDRQTQKLNALVGRLLDLSRIEANKLALERDLVDVRALAEEVADLVRRSSPDREVTIHAPESVEAWLDPLRFEQVLVNLLDNAVKFSPADAPIEVTLATDANGALTLSVRDHGVGVPPDLRAGLFERFHQAHGDGYQGGMGLGLYISRQIVELHGGRIRAEFPDTGGTEFIVELPGRDVGTSS